MNKPGAPADPEAPGKGGEKKASPYKDTLNLPTTGFPMRGNLGQLEPKMLAFWEEKKIYEAVLAKNAGGERFVLHDGPPYANGNMHMGHALNRVLKDIVVKYRNLEGRPCELVPGWDCHGLPIEQAVEKRLSAKKIDRKSLSRADFLEACRDYALEFIDVQRSELLRLGLFGRWERPYRTLDRSYEAQEVRELATLAEKGLLYRRNKPVHWCVTHQTSLAEAEVEYQQHSSPSIYVAFEATGDLGAQLPALKEVLAGKKVSYVIWTTTPWTLPANLAVAVHPELEYVFYALGGGTEGGGAEAGDRVLCVARELLPKVLAEVAQGELEVREVKMPGADETVSTAALVDPARILGYVQGAELVGATYRHPFLERESRIFTGEHVTLEQGTGLVHTAPGHGQEDYELGLEHGLEVYNPVLPDGRYDATVGEALAGVRVAKAANEKVLDLLVERGALLNPRDQQVDHSYPHCWRCQNPIIFRATPQWFVALDTGLRERALAEVDRVAWVPRWGKDRIRSMLEVRPDWCISRQRQWGVPLPILYCERCEHPVVSPALMNRVADAVEESGIAVWYSEPVERFATEDTARCAECGHGGFRKETDILDVWFDSACSFSAVAEREPGLGLPIDLYLEGSDQHRGWFHSSLLVGTGTRGRAPYDTVLTHGFVVDGKGEKMSKSRGNTVAPDKVIKELGAEILRLWVAAADYRGDVRLSKEILQGLAEGYRRIRNTLRYALSNLSDFEPSKDAVAPDALTPLDRWAATRLDELIVRVRRAYEEYDFHLVFHAIVDFCATDLSARYFDILKDRLYADPASGPTRRSAQTVLHRIAADLLRLLAPVTSFTAEEAWQHLPGRVEESVFLAGLPTPSGLERDAALMTRYEQLFGLRGEVQRLLEAARRSKLIGASQEAALELTVEGAGRDELEAALDELPALFLVSQVRLVGQAAAEAALLPWPQGPEGAAVKARVVHAEGAKCPRCWLWIESLGEAARKAASTGDDREPAADGQAGAFEEHPDVCPRCRDALAARAAATGRG